MKSPKSGCPVANQYLITIDEPIKSINDLIKSKTATKIYFQSYRTLIAVKDIITGEILLDQDAWNYSRTTGKYRNIFLNENTAETRKKIKSGEYKLVNLN